MFPIFDLFYSTSSTKKILSIAMDKMNGCAAGGVGRWQKNWRPSRLTVGRAKYLIDTSFAMTKTIKWALNGHKNPIFDSFSGKRIFCNRDGYALIGI